MPRQRLPEGEKKIAVTIRIKEKYLQEINKQGSPQEVIERIIEKYFKK